MAQTLTPPRPTLEDPEPRPSPTSPARRRVSARDAIVTVVVCLVLWSLLFAPMLERERGDLAGRHSQDGRPGAPAAAVGGLGRDRDRTRRRPRHARARPRPRGAPGRRDRASRRPRPAAAPAGRRRRGPRPPLAAPPVPVADRAGRRRGGTRPAGRRRPGRRAPPGIRTPTQDAKLRVAVIGDSLSQGLGPGDRAVVRPRREPGAAARPAVDRALARRTTSTGRSRCARSRTSSGPTCCS